MRNRMEIGAVAAGTVAILLLVSLTVYKTKSVEMSEKQVATTLLNSFADNLVLEKQLTLDRYEDLLNEISGLSGKYKIEISVGRELVPANVFPEEETAENEPEKYSANERILEMMYTTEIVGHLNKQESLLLEAGDIVTIKLIQLDNASGGESGWDMFSVYGLKNSPEELTVGYVIGNGRH